ncbi:MAG: phosphohistidine phosphatase SixA [Desulfovermiculus sp.]
MAVYLVQHGKNMPKEQDPEQPLSEEGRADVQRVAEMARKRNISVSRVLHSPKLRARQTAEILADALGVSGGCQEREGIKALDDPRPVAEALSSRDNLMLVGHLPFMSKLAAYLVTGNPDLTVVSFQNGGIVALDEGKEDEGWVLSWTLFPSFSI